MRCEYIEWYFQKCNEYEEKENHLQNITKSIQEIENDLEEKKIEEESVKNKILECTGEINVLQKELSDKKTDLIKQLNELNGMDLKEIESEMSILEQDEKLKPIYDMKKDFVDFLEKESRNKKIFEISKAFQETSLEDVINLSKNFENLDALCERCNKIPSIKPYQAPKEDKNSKTSKYLMFGIVAIFWLLLVFVSLYTFDFKEATKDVAIWSANFVWRAFGVLIIGLVIALIVGVCVGLKKGFSDGIVAFIVAAIMAIIVAVVLALISFSFFEVSKVNPPPELTDKVSAFINDVVNDMIHIMPSILWTLFFFIVIMLFIIICLIEVIFIKDRRKHANVFFVQYESDKNGYIILYHFSVIVAFMQKVKLIQEMEEELAAIGGTYDKYDNKVEKEMIPTSEKYQGSREKTDNEKEYIVRFKDEVHKTRIGKENQEKLLEEFNSKLTQIEENIKEKKQRKAELERELRKQKSAMTILGKVLKEISAKFETDSDEPLEITKGILCDKLYFDIGVKKDVGFMKFKKVTHNCEKIVCLYDEEEILNGNLSISLEKYIDWMAAAFTRVNYWEIFEEIKFRIIDVVSGGKSFVGGQRGNSYIVYGNLLEIQKYGKEINKKIREVTKLCDCYKLEKVDIAALNEELLKNAICCKRKFGEEKMNMEYNICFIVIPNRTSQNPHPENILQPLWTDFNGCERYGIMPVFFVGEETWREMDKATPIKIQVKREHIFKIWSTENKTIDIEQYES